MESGRHGTFNASALKGPAMFDWTTFVVACIACFALGLAASRVAWSSLFMRARPAHPAVLRGTVGRVSIAVPPAGVGAIAYMRFGRRATLPARTSDGRGIERGRLAVILAIERKVALVEELSNDIQEVFR